MKLLDAMLTLETSKGVFGGNNDFSNVSVWLQALRKRGQKVNGLT